MVKLKTLSKKTAFVLAVAGATVVGGASTVLVRAAIPDTAGVIHGCYRGSGLLTNGTLRVVDTDAGKTCNSNETSLNWNQSSSGGSSAPVVHDANGQALGTLLETSGGTSVYNATLHRVIHMIQGGYNNQIEIGDDTSPYFTTTDCTGTPYTDAQPGSKLALFTWRNGGTPSYAIVADTAQADSTIVQHSVLAVDEYHPEGVCHDDYPVPDSRSSYALTAVSLPFSTPLALPYKY
jgi:hypothetical protein